MARLLLYSKKGCPFCSLLKHELRIREIEFEEFDLSDENIRRTFYEASGTNTVPQLYLSDLPASLTHPSGEALGGWQQVSKVLETLGDRVGV